MMLVRHTILSLCFFSSMLSQKLVIAEAVLQKIDSSQKSRTNSLRGPPVIEQEEIQETRNLAVVDAGSPGNQQRLHDDAKNRWYIQSANKGTYRYTLSRQCNKCNDFGYPWTVVMNAGSPAQAMDKDFKPRTGALSVAQMFTSIQDAINDPKKSVLATYDNDIGFPNTMQIDDGTGPTGVVTSTVYGFLFEQGSPQEQLTKNREIWKKQKINDYDFTYFRDGPNPHNIQWPLKVQVRGGTPVFTTDRNGNKVNYLIPQTFEQLFEMVQRQIDKQTGVLIDNDYSKRGYPREINLVSQQIGSWNYHFCTFTDAVV